MKQWTFEVTECSPTHAYRRTMDVVPDANGIEVGVNETPYLPIPE